MLDLSLIHLIGSLLPMLMHLHLQHGPHLLFIILYLFLFVFDVLIEQHLVRPLAVCCLVHPSLRLHTMSSATETASSLLTLLRQGTPHSKAHPLGSLIEHVVLVTVASAVQFLLLEVR